MKYQKQILALLAMLLAALGITVSVVVTREGGDRPSSVTVKVDGADADRKRDDKLVVTPAAQEVRHDLAESSDVSAPMRGPDASRAGVVTGPLASQEWPGCKTAFVGSFSSRRGVKPSALALHYTAGANTVGWADVDGLTAYSNRAANQVSWHFSVDREGHCAYNVPVTEKAWTIAGLNSQTINIEVVGTGRDSTYAGSAGLAKLTAITLRIRRVYGIPLRLGATDGNCRVTRSGIITHWMGGPCSGGHHDIRPYALVPLIAHFQKAVSVVPKPVPVVLPPCTVRNLQARLRVTADGVVGPRTRDAIGALQRRHGLPVTRMAGARVGRILGLAGCSV